MSNTRIKVNIIILTHNTPDRTLDTNIGMQDSNEPTGIQIAFYIKNRRQHALHMVNEPTVMQ